MRVLALCSYPQVAAATRFRVEQFVGPLRERGIEIDLRPFLTDRQFEQMCSGGNVIGKAAGLVGSVAKRFGDVFAKN